MSTNNPYTDDLYNDYDNDDDFDNQDIDLLDLYIEEPEESLTQN
jgi:hypothetical protein